MSTTLDFIIIDTDNCKTLGIIDTSSYDVNQTIASPVITIYPPGTTVYSDMSFIPRKVNIYNSNNMNLTRTDSGNGLINLPDGIYRVKYTIKPSATYTVEKCFLRTCKLRCKYNNAILQADALGCNDYLRGFKTSKLKEIDFLIISAEANAFIGDKKTALDLYKLADYELDKLNAKCSK